MERVAVERELGSGQSDIRPHKQISCFTSFHSQNDHAVGGYLYLLFNLRLVIVAYLSTFIDKIAIN